MSVAVLEKPAIPSCGRKGNQVNHCLKSPEITPHSTVLEDFWDNKLTHEVLLYCLSETLLSAAGNSMFLKIAGQKWANNHGL